MFTNQTIDKINDQYSIRKNSNRVHLKEGRRIIPSSETLDRIADQKLTGGYNRRNVLCKICNTKKSISGSCFC